MMDDDVKEEETILREWISFQRYKNFRHYSKSGDLWIWTNAINALMAKWTTKATWQEVSDPNYSFW